MAWVCCHMMVKDAKDHHKRLQGKGRKHHISLPSIMVHHEPHPSHLRGDVLLVPTQAELVGPASLPSPSLSVPNCPSAHLTYLWDLASLCWTPAPSVPQKLRFTLCCAQPNCLWATSPSLYKDTQCDHQPSTWGGLTTTFPLPPLFPFPFLGGRGEKPSPCQAQAIFRGASALGGGMRHQKACRIDLTWGSAWAFCRVLKGSFVLFLGPHIFLCAIGQAAPLCYRSCDADRDEALSWSLGCVGLCTPRPLGQFAIICIMGPIVCSQAWIKCPVCVHACTRVQRTPWGTPCSRHTGPRARCHSWRCSLASLTYHIKVTTLTKVTPCLCCFKVR